MFGSIKAGIIDYINQSALVNPQWVYNYEPTMPGGFPAIAVTAFSGEGVFADTQRNRRSYFFRIRIYQERQTVGTDKGLEPQSESERVMVNLVDSLIGVFDNYNNGSYNLGGIPNLVFVKPIPQEWGYLQSSQADVRIADIKLEAVVVV